MKHTIIFTTFLNSSILSAQEVGGREAKEHCGRRQSGKEEEESLESYRLIDTVGIDYLIIDFVMDLGITVTHGDWIRSCVDY